MISYSTLKSTIKKKGFAWEPDETPISQLSEGERKAHLGLRVDEAELRATAEAIKAVAYMRLKTFSVAAPAAVDWRSNGGNFITPIKDQQSCGSCVSFATCATLESRIRIVCKNASFAVDLAEAQLFYCGCGNCCGTGWDFPPALDFCRTTGVASESSFPYVPGNRPCPGGITPYIKIDSWAAILSIPDRKDVIANKGPVVAGLAVYEDFFNYRSGVYRHTTGALAGYHAVSVVGYSDAEGCWICKNSWGPGWGDGGFFKIAYGDSEIDTSFAFYDVSLKCPEDKGPTDKCKEYAQYLLQVLQAARTHRGLRQCLRHYICGVGLRPACTREILKIVQNVTLILRACPQYRRSFCAGLAH